MNLKPAFQTKSSVSSTSIFYPILAILGLLVLLIFVIPSTYSKIAGGIETYKNKKAEEQIIRSKIDVLQSAPSSLLDQSVPAVNALPDKNAAVVLLSQIREVGLANNAAIANIKTKGVSEIDEDIRKIELTFQIAAENYDSLMAVINEIPKRAPLSTIDLIEFKGQIENLKTADVTISVYWSDLPKTLPPTSEPLVSFTLEEIEILNKITALQKGQFNELSPDSTQTRENPFN